MYALAIIRYRRPLEEAEGFREAHRNYLLDLKKQGLLLASGPFGILVVPSCCGCRMRITARHWTAFAMKIRLRNRNWRSTNCSSGMLRRAWRTWTRFSNLGVALGPCIRDKAAFCK
jgi:hypothetical protein